MIVSAIRYFCIFLFFIFSIFTTSAYYAIRNDAIHISLRDKLCTFDVICHPPLKNKIISISDILNFISREALYLKLIFLFFNRKRNKIPFYLSETWVKFFIFIIGWRIVELCLVIKEMPLDVFYSPCLVLYLCADVILFLPYIYFFIKNNNHRIMILNEFSSEILIFKLLILIIPSLFYISISSL